jgi:YidC/Oxa1 family membrane protein insertase
MLKTLNNLLVKFKSFFTSLNIITELKNIKPKFIFFSENKSYQKYSKPIIDVLCKEYPNQIYYFSIDEEDKIDDIRVKNYFISYLLIKFFFNSVNTENMFLTLTDLGNHFIKKNKKVDKYIYYFHSPISTTKSYTPKAFDNYDTIMCNGNFQIEEIKSREKLKNLKKKELIPTGYFYLDFLAENIDLKKNNNEILIAPSWNYNLKNSINENFIELISILLDKKQKVIFRPHPEHYKRSKKILQNIKNKFSNENFKFDDNSENIGSMEKAKCLITDSSGIAIEYIMTLKRPVLYLDEFDKIHNNEFNDYSDLKTIDYKIKENFGYLFKKKEFDQIDIIINQSIEDFKNKIPTLDSFINENFSNYGKTKDYFAEISKKIF